jgi:hypothetical protein
MRFTRTLILVGAAACCAWFAPQPGIAGDVQQTPLTPEAFALATDGAAAPPQSPVVPPNAFSLDAPPNAQDVDDKLVEEPKYACACGCGIFEVGTASMLPRGAGGMLYLEYDYQNQNINWSGVKPAPSTANGDKEIRTDFVTLGLEYFFNRSWGFQVELPYDDRFFKTTGANGDVDSIEWGDFGDARLQAIYTGFFEDQSLGVNFGTKVPTGSWTHNDSNDDADRDSELGTGTVSLLAGGFYRHQITDSITGFTQVLLDAPVTQTAGYRPGVEADGSFGVYVTGIKVGGVSITPIGQLLVSERGHDSGPNAAHPLASGYQRLLLSPGLEFDVHPLTFYADVEVPFYQHFSGDQLTAPLLFKFIMTYHF